MDNSNNSDKALSKINDKLDVIIKSLDKKPRKELISDNWMDVQEVCRTLNICKRTLQYYRKNETLPSSQIAGKVYFKASDVQKVLEKNYTK